MKNSGIEWIGQIPDSWQYFRLKDYYVFEKGKNAALYTQEYIGTHNGEFPVYSGQTENDGIMGTISSFDYDEKECLFTTTVGAKVMTPKVLSGKFSLSQNCLVMKQVKPCCNKYIFYQLLPLFDYTKSMIPSYMQPSLRIADLNTYGFFVPNKSIQEQIANCLDVKCAKIDKLIEVQQAQIEKLKEYKQSVITEAVTKGLNPTAPMKDSGVEWIGKIPEGWKVCRIKNLPDYSVENCFIDGDWIESPDIADSGIRYLTTGNVGDGQFKYQGNGYITQETFDKLNCKFAYPGDWVIARLNAPYGRSCILPNDKDRYVLAVDIVILRTQYNKKYFCYFTQCPEFQHTVEDYARGTAMKRISRTNLGAVKTVLPSIEEQNEIADYLDNKCAKIDKLIALKQSKIEKLQEYKKSLIYEYVTGKREVM